MTLTVGDIVYFLVPSGYREVLYGRQYLVPGAHLIKLIATQENDTVRIVNDTANISCMTAETIYHTDSRGQLLPHLRFCRTLSKVPAMPGIATVGGFHHQTIVVAMLILRPAPEFCSHLYTLAAIYLFNF